MPNIAKWKRLLSCCLLAVGIGATMFLFAGASTPAHNSKDIQYWFAELTSASPTQRALAKEAFDSMGSRSLRFLLSQVKADVPPFTQTARTWFDRKILGRIQIFECGVGQLTEAEMRQERLIVAFGILGSHASSATRELELALSNPLCRHEAANSLIAIGPAARPAIERNIASSEPELQQSIVLALGNATLDKTNACRLLLNALRDSNGLTRHYAAFALGKLYVCPEQSVPALTAALGDADTRVRYISLFALQKFGTNAVPSLPAIRRLQSDSEESVRSSAIETAALLENFTSAISP